MTLLLAIDPGEKHCGLARLEPVGGGGGSGRLPPRPPSYQPFRVEVVAPDALDRILADPKLYIAKVVCEEYRIYDAPGNQWSTVPTVEVIGVIKYLCDRGGIPVVMQKAEIKKPTRGILRGRGIEMPLHSLPSELANHANDALLHGYYYLLQGQNT